MSKLYYLNYFVFALFIFGITFGNLPENINNLAVISSIILGVSLCSESESKKSQGGQNGRR